MKNNTRIRLHLSKSLFESIAKEVLAESKKMNMSGGAYTEAVKMPKAKKSAEKMTDKMKKMEEGQQGSVENIKVGAKVHPHGQPEKIMTVISPDGGFGGKVSVKDEKGGTYSFAAEDLELVESMKEVNATADTENMRRMHEMSSKEKMAKGLYKEDEMEEMQVNVAEEGQVNEIQMLLLGKLLQQVWQLLD